MSAAPETGRKEIGILFVDLVDSSVFASTLSVEDYARYVAAFKQMALTQCTHFFERHLEGKYAQGTHYQAKIVGDELVVFLSSGRPSNDVYLLTLLAALLKVAWIGTEFNRRLLAGGLPPSDLAAGINHGMVWAEWQGDSYQFTGYAINLAKRIESRSRVGSRYCIFLSDRAHKLINRKVRNLLFGGRQFFEAKGILGVVGVCELAHCFFSPDGRLAPELAEGLAEVLQSAMPVEARDSWIHDFIQNWSEIQAGGVTDAAMERCQQVLHYDPNNPLALYYLAQGFAERKRHPMARILYQRLISAWPGFGDAHLEYARVLLETGDPVTARESLRRALILGVDEAAGLLEEIGEGIVEA